MADTKLTALTALTSLSGDETFYVVDDDDGTPVSKKMTVENLASGLAGRSEFTSAFAVDSAVVHDTGDETVAGVKTFSSAPVIPSDVYDSSWNGLQEPAPKDAVWDALGAVTAAGKSMIAAADAAAQAVLLGGEVFKQAQAVNAQTGTTYTLDSTDAGKLVTLSNGSAITLTVPQDSDETIAVGTYIDLYQLGAGQVTVVAGSGATLRVSGLTAKARAQYSRFAVQKVSANTWSLFGDLAAS